MPDLDTNNNLTTLELAREYLGESESTKMTQRLQGAINAASARANNETGRLLKARAHSEIHDGDGTQRLLLKHFPVVADTSDDLQVYVVGARNSYAGTTDFDSDSQVDFDDIYVDASMGELTIKDNTFLRGTRNVLVSYTAGYDTTGATTASNHVPGDLQDAVHQIMAFEHERSRHRGWATRTITHDDGSVTYFDSVPITAVTVLERYRDWRS